MEEIRCGRALSRVLADGDPPRGDRPRRGYGELIDQAPKGGAYVTTRQQLQRENIIAAIEYQRAPARIAAGDPGWRYADAVLRSTRNLFASVARPHWVASHANAIAPGTRKG